MKATEEQQILGMLLDAIDEYDEDQYPEGIEGMTPREIFIEGLKRGIAISLIAIAPEPQRDILMNLLQKEVEMKKPCPPASTAPGAKEKSASPKDGPASNSPEFF